MSSGKARVKDPARAKFAARLVTRRKERGFETAYAFFHRPGGRRHFGFSYQHFLLIEKGVRLPSPESLEAVLDALGSVDSYHAERLELLELYVRALLAGNPLFEPLFASRREPARGGASPEADILSVAARKAVGDVPRFTLEQLDTLTSSQACFVIGEFLQTTGYSMTAEQLSVALEYPVAEAASALRRLTEAGIVTADKDGRFRSPDFEAGKFFPARWGGHERSAWISEQLGAFGRVKERMHFYNFICLALEPGQRAGTLTELLRDTLRKATLLRSPSVVGEGEFVTVETRICYRPIREPGAVPK